MNTSITIGLALLLGATVSYAKDEKQQLIELADRLDSCKEYTQKFVHPLTGESLTRKIGGVVDGKCIYIEKMPNGGKLECGYSTELQKIIAQSYRDSANAKSIKSSVDTSLQGGKVKNTTTYLLDGKEVENPLQEALKNGQCTVTGY